jgi:hypothetical protein
VLVPDEDALSVQAQMTRLPRERQRPHDPQTRPVHSTASPPPVHRRGRGGTGA